MEDKNKDIKNQNQEFFEDAMKESREGNKKFQWNLAIFSGACLALLFQFLDRAYLFFDDKSSNFIKLSVFFLLVSLISSPIVNFLSESITSLFAQSRRDWVIDNISAVNKHDRAVFLTIIRFVLICLSMISAFFGLIFLIAAVWNVYLL